MVLVIVIVAFSVGYALWHIRKSFKYATDPCHGCTGCVLKDQRNKKEGCEKKKNEEKFGQEKKIH